MYGAIVYYVHINALYRLNQWFRAYRPMVFANKKCATQRIKARNKEREEVQHTHNEQPDRYSYSCYS